MKLRWGEAALEDLESIHDYVGSESVRNAEVLIIRIIESVQRLKSFPNSGRVVPESRDHGLREIFVKPYRIVYRRNEKSIDIVAVIHGARMFPGDVPEIDQ